MVSTEITRHRTRSWAARLAVAMLIAGVWSRPAPRPAPCRRRQRRSQPPAPRPPRPSAAEPSAERGDGARLRDGPGRPERLLRDRLRHPVQAVGGVHEAVPERDLGHQAGPVHEPDDGHAATALGRQPAGPDPAALDGLARQGRAAQEPGRLRDRVRLGPVVRRAAGPEPRRRGRHARFRIALRDGSQLQHDRRLLQQGAGRADRHDRAADDGRRVRGPARQGQGRRAPADHAVERHGQRRRARLPAPEPDGRLRTDRADQRLDLPEAGRDHRYADATSRPPSTSSSGSRPGTSRRTPTPSSTPTPMPASARAKVCSCSTATGRTPSTTRICRATSASSSSRRPRRAASSRRCRLR